VKKGNPTAGKGKNGKAVVGYKCEKGKTYRWERERRQSGGKKMSGHKKAYR